MPGRFHESSIVIYQPGVDTKLGYVHGALQEVIEVRSRGPAGQSITIPGVRGTWTCYVSHNRSAVLIEESAPPDIIALVWPVRDGWHSVRELKRDVPAPSHYSHEPFEERRTFRAVRSSTRWTLVGIAFIYVSMFAPLSQLLTAGSLLTWVIFSAAAGGGLVAAWALARRVLVTQRDAISRLTQDFEGSRRRERDLEAKLRERYGRGVEQLQIALREFDAFNVANAPRTFITCGKCGGTATVHVPEHVERVEKRTPKSTGGSQSFYNSSAAQSYGAGWPNSSAETEWDVETEDVLVPAKDERCPSCRGQGKVQRIGKVPDEEVFRYVVSRWPWVTEKYVRAVERWRAGTPGPSDGTIVSYAPSSS